MNPLFYTVIRESCRWVRRICIREHVLFAERVRCNQPLLLAVTHLSHLEPMFVTLHLRQRVRWMTRIEFYSTWWSRLLLNRCGAICVDRFGYSLPAVRESIRQIGRGETIGIFPEGGVATGPDSVLRGGPIKQGVCTIAIRSGVPIVPVVVLGTHQLNRVAPWLPARRGTVWIGYGEPITPPPQPHRLNNRKARTELAERLQAGFGEVYQQLLEEFQLRDDEVP